MPRSAEVIEQSHPAIALAASVANERIDAATNLPAAVATRTRLAFNSASRSQRRTRGTQMNVSRPLLILLAVAIAAYLAYTGLVLIAWRSTGMCQQVAEISSPTGSSTVEIGTCGTQADALETTIWFSENHIGTRILYARTPVSPEIFDGGILAIRSEILDDVRVTWRDASHVEVSVRDNASWKQDFDAYHGVTFTLRRRARDETR